MSTTSRLVVPSTSISPEISKLVNTEVPAAVTIPVVVRFSLPKLIAPELSVTLPEPIVSVPAVRVSNQPFSHLTAVDPKLSVLSVSERILEPLVIPPVATCVAVVVSTPVTSAVVAIFTAPSISTTSRFAVPSISISPATVKPAAPTNFKSSALSSQSI